MSGPRVSGTFVNESLSRRVSLMASLPLAAERAVADYESITTLMPAARG